MSTLRVVTASAVDHLINFGEKSLWDHVPVDPLTDIDLACHAIQVLVVGEDGLFDVSCEGEGLEVAANPLQLVGGASQGEGGVWVGGPQQILTLCTRKGREWLCGGKSIGNHM